MNMFEFLLPIAAVLVGLVAVLHLKRATKRLDDASRSAHTPPAE